MNINTYVNSAYYHITISPSFPDVNLITVLTLYPNTFPQFFSLFTLFFLSTNIYLNLLCGLKDVTILCCFSVLLILSDRPLIYVFLLGLIFSVCDTILAVVQ